ncbi:MAG: HAD family phosphatase [Planctomycetia bacterium]|jgi:HAD superfamily hydrolase (TIGR01509 family)
MKVCAVAFDMDGLMFNTEDVYSDTGSVLLERRGHKFTKDLKDAMMGLNPKLSFEVMIDWYSLEDDWKSLAEESEEVFLGLLESSLAPMTGLLGLLDRLESLGIPKAVTTSSSHRLLTAILTQAGLLGRFAFTLTFEDIKNGKPHPEIYQTAAARFGVTPESMLVLEDSHNGVVSASKAGAYTVAVPNEHTVHLDFSAADLIVDSLEDQRLLELLN